jgi:N-acetylneuraminic acid mutarotase
MSSWLPGLSILNAHQFLGAAVLGELFNGPLAGSLRLYVVGGSGNSGDVEVLMPASFSREGEQPPKWVAAPSLLTPRFGHAVSVASTGGYYRIYAIGGRSHSGALLSGAECYPQNPKELSWGAVKAMPVARERAAAAQSGDVIYVAGGSNNSAVDMSSPLNTLEAYDPATNSWKTLHHMHAARDGAAAVAGSDGRIYVIGGLNASGSLNTVEAYDPATNSWSYVASMNTPRDGLGATVGSDGQIYAVGGENGPEVLATVEVYNLAAKTWTAGPAMSTARVNLAVATAPDGLIYAIGGLTAFLGPTNSVEVLSSV